MAEAGNNPEAENFGTIDPGEGKKAYSLKNEKGEEIILPQISGGQPTPKEVVEAIADLRQKHPSLKSDEELSNVEPTLKNLLIQRLVFLEDAERRGLLSRIDRQATTIRNQLESGRILSDAAEKELTKFRDEVKNEVPEPPDLQGIFDAFTQKRIEDFQYYIDQVQAKHTVQSIEDVPRILDRNLSEWEELKIAPRPYEEGQILQLIARLPAEGTYKIGDQEVSGEGLKEFMLARMNFLRLWVISNNEEGGGDPKAMAEILRGWHDGWFPLLFKNIKTNGEGAGASKGEGLEVVFRFYLGEYMEQDKMLQEWIKNNQGLSDEEYDEKLGKEFGKLLIGANPDKLRDMRRENTKKYGVLAERIGFEFTHMFTSSYFDRGVKLRKARRERFGDKTYFLKRLFGNSPYSNRFIDHLEAFMSSESRGRPEINRYFRNLVHVIKSDRIERDLLRQVSDDKGKKFDENLEGKDGIGFDFLSSDIDWKEILENPEEVGMGTFFTVYDDREKSAAMRSAVQDFLQGPDEATFMEVMKSFRSTRSGIRDPFVREFTKKFIGFMRHENKAVFDLKNWDTAKTEGFVEKLKAAHLLDSRDAGAILREELGVNFIPGPAWALYTPLKRMFPDSPITRSYENFLHSDKIKFLEKIHIPGWGWVRNIRKTGDWKTYLGASWAGISKFFSELFKAEQRDLGGGRH